MMETGTQLVDHQGQALNHVDLVYRPGERQLVGKVFEVLNCGVWDRPGKAHLVVYVDKEEPDITKNVLFASAATPEQMRLEQLLQSHLADNPELSQAHSVYQNLLNRSPQLATHFAIHLPSTNALEEILEKVREASDSSLGDRLEVSAVFRPGDPGAIVDTIVQAFVKTDVFAAGLLCLSQRIELQAAANS